MSSMPWFRFYSEALNDRKITRAVRMSGQPKATVIGVWTTLLCLSNESPERGRLLISDDMWLTDEEIQAETGLDPVAYGKIIQAFQKLNMISVSAGMEILNWNDRQFPSDNSTARVKEWREKKRAETEVKQPETLQQRYSNVIDTDKIRLDTDTDKIQNGGPYLPSDMATEALQEKWAEWLVYQAERGKPLTQSTANKQFQMLYQWGGERFIQAIDNSIANNWTALVEPKNGKGQQPAKPEPVYQSRVY